MSKQVTTGAAVNRRRRTQVMLGAEVTAAGGVRAKHRIKDLSETGARIDSAATLKVGEIILISVGDLEAINAEVIWTSGNAAGIRFGQPIDLTKARAKTIVAPKNGSDTRDGCKSPAEKNSPSASIAAGWAESLVDPYKNSRR